jgi:hypothetical protein
LDRERKGKRYSDSDLKNRDLEAGEERQGDSWGECGPRGLRLEAGM